METVTPVSYTHLVQLIESLGKIINSTPDERYKNIALATTAIDYPKFLQYFANIDVNVRVVFLDALSLIHICLVKNVVENAIMKKLYKLPIKEKIFMMSWK